MNVDSVLVGIGSSDRIAQGMFFRLTFAQHRLGPIKLSVFSFAADAQNAFDKLDAADGLAQPVSTLAVTPGQEAAVFDVLVRPAAIGITAADLANYLNELELGLSLTSMTSIDVAAAQNGGTERDSLQAELDSAEKAKDPLAVFGTYARYLNILIILALVVALLYLGEKAVRTVRAAA